MAKLCVKRCKVQTKPTPGIAAVGRDKNQTYAWCNPLSDEDESRYLKSMAPIPSSLFRRALVTTCFRALFALGLLLACQLPALAQDGQNQGGQNQGSQAQAEQEQQPDAHTSAVACMDLESLDAEVAKLAQVVGEALLHLDASMGELKTKPSALFERSQSYWLESRGAACSAGDADQASTCLCETGLARRADLTKLYQTLQAATTPLHDQ